MVASCPRFPKITCRVCIDGHTPRAVFKDPCTMEAIGTLFGERRGHRTAIYIAGRNRPRRNPAVRGYPAGHRWGPGRCRPPTGPPGGPGRVGPASPSGRATRSVGPTRRRPTDATRSSNGRWLQCHLPGRRALARPFADCYCRARRNI